MTQWRRRKGRLKIYWKGLNTVIINDNDYSGGPVGAIDWCEIDWHLTQWPDPYIIEGIVNDHLLKASVVRGPLLTIIMMVLDLDEGWWRLPEAIYWTLYQPEEGIIDSVCNWCVCIETIDWQKLKARRKLTIVWNTEGRPEGEYWSQCDWRPVLVKARKPTILWEDWWPLKESDSDPVKPDGLKWWPSNNVIVLI